jgi:signal transduction histidine kinase
MTDAAIPLKSERETQDSVTGLPLTDPDITGRHSDVNSASGGPETAAPPDRPPGIERRGQLEHRERQIDAIRRISEALFSHLSVDDMVREILHVAIEVLRADVGSVQLYDAENDALVFRYVNDPSAQMLINYAMPASEGIAGRVFQSGTADVTQQVDERPEFNQAIDQLTGYHTRSMLTAPLKRFEGKPVGVVQILNAQNAFDAYDLEVLEVLCAYAATSIETAQLMEKARQAEIVNLIGDISHDIKNMLTPIQAGVWTLQPMLQQAFDDLAVLQRCCPEGEPWGHRIEQAIAYIKSESGWILENALAASEQVQARTHEIANVVKGEIAPPVFEWSDLNDTANSVAGSLKAVAVRGGVELYLDLDASLRNMLFDPRQMYNALYNLVNNALEATPSGGSVKIRTRHSHTDSNEVLVEVEDTGPGMPDHVRERLFTDAAITTKVGGTGIGTRIVASVVRRHRGRLSVDSEKDRGTIISITLPVEQP